MEFLVLSSLFDPEPTATNKLLPSLEKTMSRVEWPPAGISEISVSAGPVAFRSPFL